MCPAVGNRCAITRCVAICDSRNIWEEATADNVARWERDGRGPIAATGAEIDGSVRTRDRLAAPDVQYHVIEAPVLFDDLAHRCAGPSRYWSPPSTCRAAAGSGCAARTGRTRR
jgi:hypothetical protein